MKWMIGAAAAVLLGACATAEKEPGAITVYMDENGKMVMAAPKGASKEDQAIAALMNQLLNEDLAKDDRPPQTLSESEIWRKDPDDHLTHIQSGATCPATWSGLVRERTTIFRPDGMDVGCNYLDPKTPTVMTFYVFTSPTGKSSVDEMLDEAIDAMTTRQPTAKETPFAAPSARGDYKAFTIAYSNADGVKMRTSAIVGEVGGWFLKIRLTCTAAEAPVAEQSAALAMLGQMDRLRTKPVPPNARPDPV